MTYAIRLDAQGIIDVLEAYQGLEGQIEIQPQDLQLVQDYLNDNPNADTLKQLADIQAWLNAHDYIINKHTLGEYTDTDARWIEYLQERKAKLELYNALEQQHVDKQPFDLSLLTPIVVEEPIEMTDEIVDEVPIDTFMEDILDEVTDTEESM